MLESTDRYWELIIWFINRIWGKLRQRHKALRSAVCACRQRLWHSREPLPSWRRRHGAPLRAWVLGENSCPVGTRQRRRLASFPLSRALLWSLGVLGRSVVVFSSLPMLSFGGVVTYVLRFLVLLGSLCKRATSPSCIAGRVLCLLGSLYINRAKACFESYPKAEHAVVSQ